MGNVLNAVDHAWELYEGDRFGLAPSQLWVQIAIIWLQLKGCVNSLIFLPHKSTEYLYS